MEFTIFCGSSAGPAPLRIVVAKEQGADVTPLVLSPSLARQIEREAVAAYPNECCGLLIGRDEAGGTRVVDRLAPMANTFDPAERRHRFTIDPVAMADAERGADAEGKAVVGFYHSHPDAPARPSEYDRTHVPPWSFYSHVIVAVEKGRPAEMTCWVMNEETEAFERRELAKEEKTWGCET